MQILIAVDLGPMLGTKKPGMREVMVRLENDSTQFRSVGYVRSMSSEYGISHCAQVLKLELVLTDPTWSSTQPRIEDQTPIQATVELHTDKLLEKS